MLRQTAKQILLTGLLVIMAACAGNNKTAISDNDRLVEALAREGLVTKEIERGVVVYLPNLLFEYGSADLMADSFGKIRYLASIANEDYAADRKIALEGHTDSMGDESFNIDLSKRRTESVRQVLIESRIAPSRIETAWHGESSPLEPNTHADGSDNPEGRARNRRVEFIILNPS